MKSLGDSMITRRSLDLFKKYRGDTDARTDEIDVEVFNAIQTLIDSLRLIEKSLTSEEFREATEAQLQTACKSAEVVDEVRELARHGFESRAFRWKFWR